MGVTGEDPTNTAHTRSGGYTDIVSASKTRPSNTTQYTANDVIAESTSAGTKLTFSAAARTLGNSGLITNAVIVDSANQATKPTLLLWLFDTDPGDINDADALSLSDTELETLIGVIEFDEGFVADATSGAGGNYVLQARNINLPFEAASASQEIYGLLQVTNAYTPVSQEEFTVKLGILQD